MIQETHINKVIVLALVFVFFVPVLALAQIHSDTSAESDTGGNIGNGTTGSASASSHSTTVIDGSGNGTVEVYIKTNTDGEVHEESIKKEVQGGVEVRVSTTSKPATKLTQPTEAEAKVEAKTNVEIKNEGGMFSTFWRSFPLWTSFSTEDTTTVEVKDDGRVLTMIERTESEDAGISSLFSTIVNIFIFWR